MYWNIDEIKRANASRGHFFFSPDTMRFFRSRILSGVYGGRYFVTSERFIASDGSRPGRRYTVRVAADDGECDTAEPDGFQAFRSAKGAKARALKLAREYIMSRATAPTANGNDIEIFECWRRKFSA